MHMTSPRCYFIHTFQQTSFVTHFAQVNECGSTSELINRTYSALPLIRHKREKRLSDYRICPDHRVVSVFWSESSLTYEG